MEKNQQIFFQMEFYICLLFLVIKFDLFFMKDGDF